MPHRAAQGPVAVLDRRRFLAAASALVAAGALPARVLAFAGPQTVTVGTVEVTVLSDGLLYLPVGVIAPAADPAALTALLTAAGAKIADGVIELSATPLVIRDGGQTVLVDMGSGSGFQPTAGKLMQNLAAAGIDPASITRVVFTHAHPDHLFGAAEGGVLHLPGASYHIGAAEHGFWADPDVFQMLPADFHPFAQGAQAAFAAIGDRLSLLKAGDLVSPNVAVFDTPGHTPGHMSLEIAGGDGALVTGDAVPNAVVSFAHPDWAFGFDADPALASASRRALLARAAAGRHAVIGYHWTTPIGRCEAAGDGFRLIPA